MDDIQTKILKARSAGIPEDIIKDRVTKLGGTYTAPSTSAVGSTPSDSFTTQSSVVPEKPSGLLEKVGNFIAPRTTALVKDVAASSQTGNYVNQMNSRAKQLSDLAVAIRNETDPVKKQQLVAQSRALANGETPSAPQFSQDINKNYVDRGIGVGAELGPAVYGGLGGFNGMSGAKVGTITGAISGLAQPGASVGERLSGGAVGAGTGAITGKVLDSVLNLPKTLKGVGTEARTSVVNPKTQASDVFGADKEAAIQKGLQDMGFKGSATQQRQMLSTKFKELSGQISTFLKGNNKPIDADKARGAAESAVEKLINFDPQEPVYSRAKDKFVNQLLKSSGDAKSLFKYKQNLAGQLKNAFTKAAKGKTLTPQEEVGMAIWGKIDKIITSAVPEVKDLTLKQSILYQAAPGLKSAVNKTINAPILNKLGVNIPITNQVQAAKDLAGRGLQKAGQVVEGVLGQLPKGLNAQNLTPIGVNATNQLLKGQPETPVVPSSPADFTPTQPTTTETKTKNPYSINQDEAQMLMAMDLQKTGGKNLTKIKALADMSSGSTLNATQQKRLSALNQAEEVYKTVEQLALNAPAGLKGSLTATVGKLPGVEGGSAEDLQRVNEGLAKAISGALAGEVGVATDKDIERWMGLMPKVSDTMAERKRALQRLKDTIERSKQQLSIPDSTTIPNDPSLMFGGQ